MIFRYYFVGMLVLVAYSQGDKFAGNLPPEQDETGSRFTEDSETPEQRLPNLGANLTETGDDSVHVVAHPPGDAGVDVKDSENSQGKRSAKKASRPVPMAESVGFIPPPEKEEEKESIEEISEISETPKASSIPTLPPSIIKPGRMMNGSWYIVLYAPWCVHSQAALAEFLKTIQYIIDKNITDIVVGKIDITKHGDVAKHFKVKTTPTIFFFRRGIRYTFDHPVVSTENLVEFMLEVLSASISEVNSTSYLAELQKNHSVIFMIVHDETVDQDWQGIFLKQARDKALKAKFAFTTNPEIVEDYALRTLPSIIVLKDETAFVFKDSLTGYALSKWILSEKDVAFPTVNTSTLRKYLQPVSGRRLAFLCVSGQHTSTEERAIEVVRSMAKGRKLHQKFQFGLLEDDTIPKMMFRSNSVGAFPFFFVFEPYTGYYYLFQPGEKRGAITETSVVKFLSDVKAGNEDRLGGMTYLDQIYHLYQIGYAILQSMLVHRPYLSLTAGFCLVGAICFYLVICWQGHSNRPSSAEIRAKKALRAKRKKEEMAKREEERTRRRIEAKEASVAKSRDSVHLKQRNSKKLAEDYSDSTGSEQENS